MSFDAFVRRLFERAKDEGFEDCEVYYASGDEFSAKVFEGNVIDYNVSSALGLGFRGLFGGKMGYASTQVLDEEAVELLVTGAKTNAELIESDDVQFIYAGDKNYPVLDVYNPALDSLSAAEKIELGLKLEKATLERDKRIGQVEECCVMSSNGEKRIINTKGLNVRFQDNMIGAYTIPVAREEGKVNTGMSYDFRRDVKELDIEKLAKDAVDEAITMLDAKPVDSGVYKIALRYDAAASLLATFSDIFSADAAQKGLSLLNGREGEVIASDCVTLMDDPLYKGALSATPFDAEGVAAKTKAVIEKGRLTTLLHNLKTANKQNVASTGNAAKGSYASPVSVAPSNFYFAPSKMSFDELIKAAGEGLLITDLEGLHAGANTVSGDFSLGAKGFRIEGGAVKEAVNQITLAGNFYGLLKEIEAVASDLKFGLPGVSCVGSPTIFVKALSVAGK